MFGEMMQSIATDFVKYVMHVQVVVDQPQASNDVSNLSTSGPDDPSADTEGMAAAARAQAAAEGAGGAAPVVDDVVNTPVVKSDWDKTPRNSPCPCGSGKKFKQCHGS
ncbi:MAG: SEC-C metal-binding domain-containing protein [Acidimicrobiales bacterium]